MKTFSFVWKRADLPTWHQRTVEASTPEEAIDALHTHLAKRADFPGNVVVDHPFYEKDADGEVVATHSMTRHANPFPVMYSNEVQEIGSYQPKAKAILKTP